MRPRSLDEILGQEHLLAPGRALRRALEADKVPSMVLWGPPGSGKTTLAEVIARLTRSRFVALSAVTAGVADLRKVVEVGAPHARRAHDPVHRRDSPLQQEPAGRRPAARRERHGHADRRDDRKPVVRSQRGAVVAGARLYAARAGQCRDRADRAAGAGRHRARPGRARAADRRHGHAPPGRAGQRRRAGGAERARAGGRRGRSERARA